MSSVSERESAELRSESNFSDRKTFYSQYVVLKTIGHGGYATVKLAQHRLTGASVAVKMLLKREHWCQPVMTEVQIMMMVDHPNIISLLQVIETKKSVYLIMELAKGHQLYQHIREAGHLQEDEARGIFRQILSAVGYCHDQGIVHRDLKPDNIMVDKNGRVKIIDFGLGTQVKPGQKLSFHCGTYPFRAPELLLGRLYDGPKNDIWTLGVVLYFMVVGRVPFDAMNIPRLRRQVVSGKYYVPSDLSEELQDLLSLLMTVNPTYRPTITDVMTHPWLKEHPKGFPDPCEELIPPIPDPAIIKAMEHIGFKAQDIKDSLHQRKYDQTMASYCLLQGQALQERDCTNHAQPMNTWMAPFPSLDDPAAFPLGLRRRGSQPTLLWSSSNSQVTANGQKSGQRRARRASWPGFLPCRLLQTTPTLDQAHPCARSVPCIFPTRCGVEMSCSSENTEDNLPSHSASAESKTVPSRGQPRGFKGWTKKIGNALMRLCCCFPSKKPRLGQNRVSPQK